MLAVAVLKLNLLPWGGTSHFTVAYGNRMTVTLDDGSRVTLDAGSRLQAPRRFGGTREVTLYGEGYFDVVPDATSEWNPEIAPQATVTNSTGNR